MKYVRLLCVLLPAGLFFSTTTIAAEVEVAVKNQLDGKLNGYCLDITGGGPNVDPTRGLQAHTCYSYRGAIGSDQAFYLEGIAHGVFEVTAHDRFRTMSGKNGSESCTDRV